MKELEYDLEKNSIKITSFKIEINLKRVDRKMQRILGREWRQINSSLA